MIHAAQERFGIDAERPISLETSSLEVCKGKQIEIDESAYSLMCSVLDEIVIVVGEKPCA